MEMVSIGCRLPNGLRLEVGFSVNITNGQNAPSVAMFRKHDDYEAFTLRGTNQSLIVRDPATRKAVAMLPSSRERTPVINQVPKAFWERWKKANAKSWHLTSGNVFEVPRDATEAKAIALDARAKSPDIFLPMDQGEMKFDDTTIGKLARED